MTPRPVTSFFANSVDAMLEEIKVLANAAEIVSDKPLEFELRGFYKAGRRAFNVAQGLPADGNEPGDTEKVLAVSG